MPVRLPLLRIRLRTMIALVAFIAAMLWAWSTFLDPTGQKIRSLRADQPAYIRREAAIALGYNVPTTKVDLAVSALLLALKDPSPRVRESAIAGLSVHKSAAQRTIPEVIPLLKDPDANVRCTAALSLASLVDVDGLQRSIAIAALNDALGDERGENREAVAQTLVKLGESKAAVGILSERMLDPDPRVRGHILTIISRWAGPNDRCLIPLLLEALKDEDMGNRLEAANLLINFGISDAAMPILTQAERDGDLSVRNRALEIRKKIIMPR